MKYAVHYDPITGHIHSRENFDDDRPLVPEPGLDHLVLDEYPGPWRYVDIETKTLRHVPEQPSPLHVWNVVSKVWEEDISLATKEATKTRNRKLRESDWAQLPDVPAATREKWAEYRQALRDLPEQPGWPVNVDWPQQP